MIAANCVNGGKVQDGRSLWRYKGGWNVERLFAWVHNFRRLATRSDFRIQNSLGFVRLACVLMLRGIYEMAS